MTRLLVTGAGGMLGQDLVRRAARTPAASTVTAATRADLDITDADAVGRAVAGHDVVVNAAAWTDVDGAETRRGRRPPRSTATAVANLAPACAATGARLLHVSTDYVFAGDATTPYPEDAPTEPVNAYGRSKLVGEQAVLPAAARHRVRRPHRLALRRARPQLRRHHAAAGRPSATPSTWSTTSAASPPGRTRWPASWSRSATPPWRAAPRRGLPRHRLRRDDLVRPGPGGVRAGRPGPGPGPAHHQRRLPRARRRRPAYSVLGHDRWAAAGSPPLPDWHAESRPRFASSPCSRPVVPAPWKLVGRHPAPGLTGRPLARR